MAPGVKEDQCLELSNNNVLHLLPRTTVCLEFKNITCSMKTFCMSKCRLGEYIHFSTFSLIIKKLNNKKIKKLE